MLRTTTWTRGRRGAVTAASAAVVCLGGVVAACAGGGPGGGYTAVGAGPGGPTAVAPSGSVVLVPLDADRGRGGRDGAPRRAGSAAHARGPTPSGDPHSATPVPAPTPTGERSPGTSRPRGGPDGRTTPPAASPSPAPAPSRTTTPATPADLSWGDPATEDTDERWCQKVTVAFHNSGGTAVRSGSVTFGTHVTGALGTDWGTVESTVELPVPIAPGARRRPTWAVCVDAMGVPPIERSRERGSVPIGMRIETRDVSVRWE
ncbi:hypothetical protein ADL02_34605 [Streptomyces sp. NRRL WC-3723]|nr:hypothetical protein ADL02_34605 [Streptomyces sp. NRRL WC-3723]